MGKVAIGARRVELIDYVNVSMHRDEIVLDIGVLRHIDELLIKARVGALYSPTAAKAPAADATKLTESNARAVLLEMIVRLMHGRFQVRSAIIIALADLLNAPDTLLGLTTCGTVEAIIAKAGLVGVISNDEYEVVSSGIALLLGMAVCPAYGLLELIKIADVSAAVSLEACQAFLEPFEFTHQENIRPHAGQSSVAANLRVLLKGSTLTSKADRAEMDPPSLRCVPQYQGPAHDLAATARRTLAVELNSAESGRPGQGPTNAGEFHPQPLCNTIASLMSASAIIASGCTTRCGDLVNGAEQWGLAAADLIAQGLLKEQLVCQDELSQAATSVLILAGNVGAATDNCLKAVRALESVQKRLLRIVEIEVLLARTALNQRKATGLAAFNAAEEARRSRMEADLIKVKQQLVEKPDDKVLLKRAKGLEFHPKTYSLTLGSGTSALFDRIVTPTRWLDVYSRDFSDFIDTILTPTNEFKKPKRAKGTRDFGREEMMVRERVFNVIRGVFQNHGATGIDTPVFELRETLMGKYGEDSKLIYDLADQGGEKLSLRYDLTVPFARYIASNNVSSIKRYHIARVYRRDNPAMNRGRFREFYQCDFDIAGSYDSMIPDAEVLAVLCEILAALDLEFLVKFSDRRLLDALMEICKVPAEKFRPICSAIDKLDKESWETVREEMLEKGLDASAADRLEKFVAIKGSPRETLKALRALPEINAHKGATATLKDLDVLFNYLDAMGVLGHISFDLSLARGLDYYTGAIYEAVFTDSGSLVGSIAAGGRYDTLVGMFLPSHKQIPAVGVSIGIERIFAIIEARERARAGGINKTYTSVMVASLGGDLTVERMNICQLLWRAGISAEFIQKRNPSFKNQLEHAIDMTIPYMICFGGDEVTKGTLNVRDLNAKVETTIERTQLVPYLRELLARSAQ